MPAASLAEPTAGSVANLVWQNAAPFRVPTLDEEEISDVSLATFHLFDKDDLGNSQSGIQLAAFLGGRRVSRLRVRRARLQMLRRWLSRLRLWRLRVRRRLRLGLWLGRWVLLVMGRLRPLLDAIALLSRWQ